MGHLIKTGIGIDWPRQSAELKPSKVSWADGNHLLVHNLRGQQGSVSGIYGSAYFTDTGVA